MRTNSDGETPKGGPIKNRVSSEGWRKPLSKRETNERSRLLNSANFSCEIPFAFRKDLRTLPNVGLLSFNPGVLQELTSGGYGL
jgi:hypothetical protein